MLIDTAGLRRRGKVFEAVEKFSVVKTLQAIEECNVVILVVDARQDVSTRMPIADFVVESGRALVVAINKWDGLDRYVREKQTSRPFSSASSSSSISPASTYFSH